MLDSHLTTYIPQAVNNIWYFLHYFTSRRLRIFLSPQFEKKKVTKTWSGRVVWATNIQAGGLVRRCRRRFDLRSCHFLLFLFFSSSLSLLSFKTYISPVYTKLFLSWRFSAAFLLSLAPVRLGCSLSFSLLSLLSPSDQPHRPSVRTVTLKLVTKPFLLKRPSGLSD